MDYQSEFSKRSGLLKILLPLCLIFFSTSSVFAAGTECFTESPSEIYEANPIFKETEIKNSSISHQELLSLFPSGVSVRFYKFPNGVGIYLSKPLKGSHVGDFPSRPTLGIYKTGPNGKRILMSIERFEFSGQLDSNILIKEYSDFFNNGQEIALCNRNISGPLSFVGMLILSSGEVRASNGWAGGIEEIMAYSNGSSIGDITLPPSLIKPSKMMSYQIRTVLFKTGIRTVTETIMLPDGSKKTEINTELLYQPIQIVEAQFEGLSGRSILTQQGFRPIKALYDLGELKEP